jgi:uncharacterized membrane protein YgcG
MRHASKFSIAAVLLGALLGGCSDLYWDRRDTVAFWAGDAPASNMAIHTVDPWPPAAAKRRLTANGELMQRAAERYRTNKTTPLRPLGTSSVQTSISGGSGGGGGSSGGSQ